LDTLSHHHPSLVFVGEVRSLPSTRECSGGAYKYLTRVEVTDNDKHSSVLYYINNYGREKVL